jgi:hypothetical protein
MFRRLPSRSGKRYTPIAYAFPASPGGVSINDSTGSVVVEKTVPANTYPFTVTASNSSPPDAVQNFTLIITKRTPQLATCITRPRPIALTTATGAGIGPVTEKTPSACPVLYYHMV